MPESVLPAIPMIDPAMNQAALEAASSAVVQFSADNLQTSQIGISVLELDRSQGAWKEGGFRADWQVYPASVVKAFYLAFGAVLLERGEIELTPENERCFQDMIKDSSNDATGGVLDLITGTTGGPELPAAEFAAWRKRRLAVNEWLAARGYVGVNASQKTWNEGPYGRERQGYGPNFEHRNLATARSASILLAEIALGRIAGRTWTDWMMNTLSRSLVERDSQTRTFIGKVLPDQGYELRSKAGLAYQVRHDAAHIRRADGREVVISIFTDGHLSRPKILPFIAESILKKIGFLSDGPERWSAEAED
jgi:hypothetical protein